MEHHFFGESVEYRDENEKEEAKTYLALWKKFFIRNISDMEFINEQYIYRDRSESFDGTKFNLKTLSLKLEMAGKVHEHVILKQHWSILHYLGSYES